MFRRSPLRALLRWTSLVGTFALLAALGVARTHLHNFPLFLGALMVTAVVIVAVFVATATSDS